MVRTLSRDGKRLATDRSTGFKSNENSGSGSFCESGTGVPPVNHAQDARATFKLKAPLLFGQINDGLSRFAV
jgi:hypothetical protein